MGSYFHYHCASCRFDVSVGGPEEFYLAADGTRRVYGHPEPVTAEAAARGVDGFWMMLWCNGCIAVKRMVTLELEEPCPPLDAWAGRGRPKPGFPDDAASCPDCASELLDEIPGPLPLCPRCHAAPLSGGKVRD